jgi:hypothetical protein
MNDRILNQPINQVVIALTRKQKWLYYFFGILMLPLHFLFHSLIYFVNFDYLIHYIIIFFANNGHFNKYGFVYTEQIDFTLSIFIIVLYLVLLLFFGIKGRKNKKYKFIFLGMLSAPLVILIVMIVVLALSGPWLM